VANILIVDDEPEILQFIGGGLEEEGFEVMTAVDGQRGVELAAGSRPDLVVLDMRGPHLDGDAVADELRRMYAEIPILVITADGMAEEKARRVQAFDFLPKPFDLDRLLGIVQNRLGSST
jgi:DNA-binding response OmpR family regulator